MATRKLALATSSALTISLASVAQAAARESTAVDNSSNLYIDALVYVAVALQTGTPASDLCVNVYAYGSEDGTNYTHNATGTDAALTMESPTNLRLIGVIQVTATGDAATWKGVFAVASAFGGILPRKWGIVIENRTNLTFSATGGAHVVSYSGVTETVA